MIRCFFLAKYLLLLIFSHNTIAFSAESTASPVESEVDAKQPATADQPILAFELTGLADDEYKKNALAFLDIDDDAGKPIANPSYAEYLARIGVEQIQQSLQPFGYYSATVESSLDKTVKQWTIRYQVIKGSPVRVANVEVLVEGAGKNNKDFVKLLAKYPLKKGDILLQEKYTDFKNKILAQALASGYFDGVFTKTQIILADDLQTADIYVIYDTGERYAFGATTFKQDFLDDDVFQRYVNYEPGEVYASKSIAALQRDLYNSGYVKVIDVAANPNKNDKVVPVELTITPKKNKKHTFAIGYGTDNGIRARYDFDWRWVNRRGHNFKANLFASQKLQKGVAEYRIPALNPATDYYKIFATVKNDRSGSADSTLWNVGGAYHDKVGDLSREIGIKWQQENFKLGNDSGNIGLLTPYARLTYRRADDLMNTNDGLLLEGIVTGGHTSMLSEVSFLQAVAKAKYIKRIGESNKIKVSGSVGRTWVDNFHRLPADYRFFTGGDKTIRGYSYQSIGDIDSSGANVGGDKMYTVSGEYEYFIKDNMALAAFVDGGDVYSTEPAAFRVGAGVGFHYYSPIGPVKIDVAHGFHRPGDKVRLHFVIGPDL